MSAPAVIDALEFARSAQQSSGSVAVSALQRLEDLLYDSTGTLSYEISGKRDERNRALLELKVAGELHLQCQRCLECLEYPVDFCNTLIVLPAGTAPDPELEEPDAPDTIEADAEMDVHALVEDEVLLSLPLAPRHAEGVCEPKFETEIRASASHSAFDKLAALKRPPNKH